MPRIYISHRPEDSSRNEVAIIHKQLVRSYGTDNVLQSTGSNSEITTNLERLVESCDVMLIVIGRYWLNMVDEDGIRLLDDGFDPIRVEIEAGLQAQIPMRVILVDGVKSPNKNQLPQSIQHMLQQNTISIINKKNLDVPLRQLIEDIDKERIQYHSIPTHNVTSKSSPSLVDRIKSRIPINQLRQDARLGIQVLAALVGMFLFVSIINNLRFTKTPSGNSTEIVTEPTDDSVVINTTAYLNSPTIRPRNIDQLTPLYEINRSTNRLQFSTDGQTLTYAFGDDTLWHVNIDEGGIEEHKDITEYDSMLWDYGDNNDLVRTDGFNVFIDHRNNPDVTHYIDTKIIVIDAINKYTTTVLLETGEIFPLSNQYGFGSRPTSEFSPHDTNPYFQQTIDRQFFGVLQEGTVDIFYRNYFIDVIKAERPIRFFTFDSTSERIYTLSDDMTLTVWGYKYDAVEQVETIDLSIPHHTIIPGRTTVFSNSLGLLFIAESTQGKGLIHVWDLQPDIQFVETLEIGDLREHLKAITVSPDGRYLATASDEKIVWWYIEE